MMLEKSQINLKGPIDYLIFSSAVITLHSQAEPEIMSQGTIVDSDQKTITIRLNDIEKFRDNDVQFVISAPYKSMMLSINANLLGNRQGNEIFFSLPLQGKLLERRTKRRESILIDNGRVVVEVLALDGVLRFEDVEATDFSSNTVSLFLKRSGGLVLPGDKIIKLTIFRNHQLVLESQGTVLLVIKTRHLEGQPESYFVLVELAHRMMMPVDVGRRRRKSERVLMGQSEDARLEFLHPLNKGIKISGSIVDLSNASCSIFLDANTCPIPFGLIINNAHLYLPDTQCLEVDCRIMSVHLQELSAGASWRVGMEFANISQQLFRALSAQVQTAMSAYLVDASKADYDRLWEFYFETGFIYGGKRRQIQQYADKIFHTYRCLLNANTPLLKKILYKKDGEIKGHINAIRVFDHASIIQHLNALKAEHESAAQAVIRGITAHFMDNSVNQLTGNRYVIAYYRPDNLFPAAVFGGSERFINNLNICWVTDYEFCLMEDGYNFSKLPEGIGYRNASTQDLEKLETMLIARGLYNLIRVEGLTRERMTDLAISREYDLIGLYRYRRIFVSENARTGTQVYAICNYSSPGINLSELTNSTKLYFTGSNIEENTLLTNVIAQPIIESYRGTAMNSPVLLIEPGQPIPAGFKVQKKYVEWILDTAYVWKFKDATEAIFRNLKVYLRKHRPREAQLG